MESARGAWGPWPAGDGARLGLGVGGRRPTEGRQCEHAEISAKSGSAPTSFQGTSGRRSWRRREVSGRRQGLREVGQAPVGVWGLQRAAEVWEATTERMSRGLRPAPRKRGARGRGQRRPPGARIAEIGSESGLVFASCGVWRCWQQVPRNPHQTGSGGRGQLPWTDVALRVVWILVTTARAPPGVAGQSPVQPRRPGLAPCGATRWLLLRPLVVQQWDTGRVLPGPSRDSPGAAGDGAVGQTFGRWGRSRRRLPALRHAFPKLRPHPHGCWTGAEGVRPPQRV